MSDIKWGRGGRLPKRRPYKRDADFLIKHGGKIWLAVLLVAIWWWLS